MSYCRPSNTLVEFNGFSGGSFYFEVILSSARDASTYPSSANFTVPLARTYNAVRAIRLVNCTCAVPEVPAPQGVSIELPKVEPVIGTQFPIDPVQKVVWLPQQQGYCIDDGSFFPFIINDGVEILSELVPSSYVELPNGLGGPIPPSVPTQSILQYSQNNSRLFEDEAGVVYALPERPPPTFRSLPPAGPPVLCGPEPEGLLCRTRTHMPHTVTRVQSVWLSTQSAWVTTCTASGLLPNMKVQWITSNPYTDGSPWIVSSCPALQSLVLVREQVWKGPAPTLLPNEQYLVVARLPTLAAVATAWTASFVPNYVVYVQVQSPLPVTLFPGDPVYVSSTEGYPHRPTASTNSISVPDWTQATAGSLDFRSMLRFVGVSPLVVSGQVWVPLEVVSVNPTVNTLGVQSILVYPSGMWVVEKLIGSTVTVTSFAKNQPLAPINVSFQNSSQRLHGTVQSDLTSCPPTGSLAALIGSGQLSERIPPLSGQQVPTLFSYAARFCPLPSYVQDSNSIDPLVSMALNLPQGALQVVFRPGPCNNPIVIVPLPQGVWTDDTLSNAVVSALTAGTLLSESCCCTEQDDPKEDKPVVLNGTCSNQYRMFRSHTNRWVITSARPISLLWSETPDSRALAMFLGFIPTLNRVDQTQFVADYPTPSSMTQPQVNLENRIVVRSSVMFPQLTLSSVADCYVWTATGKCGDNIHSWTSCVPTALSRGTVVRLGCVDHMILNRCDQITWTTYKCDNANCVLTLTNPHYITMFNTIGAEQEGQEIAVKSPRRPLNLLISSTPIFRARGTFLGFSENLAGLFQYIADGIPYTPQSPTLLFLRLGPCPSITAWNSNDNVSSSSSSSSNLVPHFATLPVTLYGSVTAITHSEHNNGTVEFPTPQTISSVSIQWVDELGRTVDFRNQLVRMVLQFFCDANQDLPLI